MSQNNENQPTGPGTAPMIELRLPDHLTRGTYSNVCMLYNTPTEFLLDFISAMPSVVPEIVSRIILHPSHAKKLAKALAEKVKKHETDHGVIEETEMPALMNFAGPVAQA